jgi:NADPH:quinone reductase-like Zn-dependent oxidoreductase
VGYRYGFTLTHAKHCIYRAGQKICEEFKMTALTVTTLEVRKDRWADTRINTESMDTQLKENEVLFRVDRQAVTANNISYAASGDSLAYWEFFPADDGWGRIPAMGWAEVIGSQHPDVKVGERVWGFFPYTTHHKILAGKANAFSFSDVSAHRAAHAPVYCQFDRASSNLIYEAAREDQDSLLRGLFMTSWLVEDFIEVNDTFGAQACLITSASSKTSIALAQCVKQRGKLLSIGITSPGNVSFCESLGCYDKVVSYDAVASLDASQPVVMVDMAGSAQVIADLHNHYTDNMMHSCRIGATHYEEMGSVSGLPGAKPAFFFAPDHIKARSEELGAAEFMGMLGVAFSGFRIFCDSWMQVERRYGPEAVIETYQSVLTGKADPVAGQIVSLWPE